MADAMSFINSVFVFIVFFATIMSAGCDKRSSSSPCFVSDLVEFGDLCPIEHENTFGFQSIIMPERKNYFNTERIYERDGMRFEIVFHFYSDSSRNDSRLLESFLSENYLVSNETFAIEVYLECDGKSFTTIRNMQKFLFTYDEIGFAEFTNASFDKHIGDCFYESSLSMFSGTLNANLISEDGERTIEIIGFDVEMQLKHQPD